MDILCKELIHEVLRNHLGNAQAAKEIVEAIWDALPVQYVLLNGSHHMLYVKGRALNCESFQQGRVTLKVSGTLSEEQRRLLQAVVGWIEEVYP